MILLELLPCSQYSPFHFDSWTTYSSLFKTYGVDLFLGGHQHNYNRLFPVGAKGEPHPECVENSTVPVYIPCDNRTITIITGSPGCSGGIDTAAAPAGAVAVAIDAYGYGRLQVCRRVIWHMYNKCRRLLCVVTYLLNSMSSDCCRVSDCERNYGALLVA